MRETLGRLRYQIHRMGDILHAEACADSGQRARPRQSRTVQRTLRPEVLDSLAPGDPAAAHNRRDLRIINAVLRTEQWFERELRRRLIAGERVLEIGAGTGELVSALRRRGLPVDGLDRWPRPASLPREAAWHQADLRTFSGYGDYRVILGSLIFHQFEEPELRALAHALASARLVLASEPARWRRAKAFLAIGGTLLGAGEVTRHDGPASVDAGFLRDELPGFLGLDRSGWRCRTEITFWGNYRMTAERS